MRSLSDFQSPQQVFREGRALPPFFDNNLVDPGRVVKEFLNDPQAHIRIFYYQYLRICFEMQNPRAESLVGKIEELINNPTFLFIFYQDDDTSIFNDNQAKALISQFFGVLSSGQFTVLQAINTYPIIDTLFVHFYRSLMLLMNKAETLDNYIPRDQILGFLCTFFGIEVEFHQECIRYIESDIFVYDYSENAVYMAYIAAYDDLSYHHSQVESKEDIYAQPNSIVNPNINNLISPNRSTEVIQPPNPIITNPPKPIITNPLYAQPKPERPPSQANQANKQSYIASEFLDYTHNGEALESKVHTNLKGSETNINAISVAKSEVQSPAINNLGGYQPSEKKLPQGLATQANQLPYKETASISSGSQNKNINEYIQNIGSLQPTVPDYLTKSNPISRSQATSQQSQFGPSSSNALPPFAAKPLTPTAAYQSPLQSVPTKDYTQISNNQYNNLKQFGLQQNGIGTPINQFGSSANQFGSLPSQNAGNSQYGLQQNQFGLTQNNSQYGLQQNQYGLSQNQYGTQSNQYVSPKNQSVNPPLSHIGSTQNPSYFSSTQNQSINGTKPFSSPPNQQISSQSQYNPQTNQYGSPSVPIQSPKNSYSIQDPKKDLFYNPKIDPSLVYSPKIDVPVYKPNAGPSSSVGGKKPFGLNVSDQFTSSLTMKSMNQPFKSSVQSMKNRARNFRSSLVALKK